MDGHIAWPDSKNNQDFICHVKGLQYYSSNGCLNYTIYILFSNCFIDKYDFERWPFTLNCRFFLKIWSQNKCKSIQNISTNKQVNNSDLMKCSCIINNLIEVTTDEGRSRSTTHPDTSCRNRICTAEDNSLLISLHPSLPINNRQCYMIFTDC